MSSLRLTIRLTHRLLRGRLLRRMLPGWTALTMAGGFLFSILDYAAIADALGHPAVVLLFPAVLAALSQRGLAAVFTGPHLTWLSRQPIPPWQRTMALLPLLLESGAPLMLLAYLSHNPVGLMLLWAVMWCPLAWGLAHLPALPRIPLPRPRGPLSALLFVDLACLLRLEVRTLATLPVAALAAGGLLLRLREKGALAGEQLADGAVVLLTLAMAPVVGVMSRLVGRLGAQLDPARSPVSPMLRAASLTLVAGLAGSPAMAATAGAAPVAEVPLVGLALAAGLAGMAARQRLDTGRYGALALACGGMGVVMPGLLLPVGVFLMWQAGRELEKRR